MSSIRVTTNFRDNFGTDLGDKLITKDYLMSVYPNIAQEIGKTPELWVWGFTGSGGVLGNTVVTSTAVSTPITTFAGGTNWKQISAGNGHTAAIKTDGTLWCWGNPTAGRLGNTITVTTNVSTPITTFAGGTNWKQVSAGSQNTAAIKTDGTLWVWGSGSNGILGNGITTGNAGTPITTFAGGTDWKQVSCGAHIAAVKTDGTLWTWGSGNQGRLGTNDTTNKSTPVTTFAGGNNWKQVFTGGGHTAAIKTDGTLWAWGIGNNGQIGINNLTTISTPVTTFAGGTNWKQVSGGDAHTAAIKTDGTLWTWGSNSSGQLGTFSVSSSRATPITTFAGGTNWADTATTEPEDLYTLSAGNGNNATAIKTDGTLWTWGSSSNSVLGNGVITGNISTPITTFAGGTNWKQVSSGSQHTVSIKTDGTLWVWGSGSIGILGNGITTGSISTPITTFAGGTNWKQVSTSNQHTAAIKTDGTLWVWGSRAYGALGNGETITGGGISTPVTTFAGGTNWKQVSAGTFHTAAIKTDGTLWTWGINNSFGFIPRGQLGNASSDNASTPVTTFAGGTNWKQVSCGNFHTAAIKTDGTLWTWGYNSNPILGNGQTTGLFSTPVTTFAGGTNWKQVSCGQALTAAIKTDGTLWTWGSGSDGRLGNNSITSTPTPITTFAGGTNWKQVSCGSNHMMALFDNGVNKQLYTWGFNSSGQLGIPQSSTEWFPNQTFAGGTNWKQVSAGAFHTVAMKTDGTLWTWGGGGDGRLGNGQTTLTFTPVTTFAGGTNWKQVSGGSNFTATIESADFI